MCYIKCVMCKTKLTNIAKHISSIDFDIYATYILLLIKNN